MVLVRLMIKCPNTIAMTRLQVSSRSHLRTVLGSPTAAVEHAARHTKFDHAAYYTLQIMLALLITQSCAKT